jgi:hypothetical protein
MHGRGPCALFRIYKHGSLHGHRTNLLVLLTMTMTFAENIDANVDASRDELGRRYWKRCDSGGC